ncbi:MAG: hypothetical protein GPI91_12445 [Microcystis aeruginosa K13-10]|nr:hypothetical protein [Microcystis aeruginosa K13-10]
MATSKPVKPHTPHPTPHTLPPPKNFFSRPFNPASAMPKALRSSTPIL